MSDYICYWLAALGIFKEMDSRMSPSFEDKCAPG